MITVYSRPQCLPCKRVIDKLAAAGLEFEVVDVSKDAKAYDYVVNQLGAKSTPVVTSWTHPPILGYQPDKLADLIRYNTSDTPAT